MLAWSVVLAFEKLKQEIKVQDQVVYMMSSSPDRLQSEFKPRLTVSEFKTRLRYI